ncbi:peptidase S24 [Membranicola marinus]|uniref:Peptidase S24 n=1 Tax=Membranihabitans marinus TaxID=1227546 RepID=A0A953HPW9_9BACT|nr:S24 family peptidase [Membranihabitans marinus]MBY5959059.1 peptidase S24 [Membranihabitans marinus]
MISDVTKRFIQCHDFLKESGKVRSSRQFALEINYLPQNLNKVLKGERDIPMEPLRSAVEVFRINPTFLYLGEGKMFMRSEQEEHFRLLTVVTDDNNEEKILHVPVPAMAGYAAEVMDPDFVSELPSYRLPGYDFQYGTFRSFDISGDSMIPYLEPGDKVVCRFIEPQDWITNIRDHHVYVIVSRGNVVVKRVVNNLHRHRHLLLISDNKEFKPYRLNVNDIREVWYVKNRITTFDHSRKDQNTALQNQMETMQTAFQKQHEMLKILLEKEKHQNRENHMTYENQGNS